MTITELAPAGGEAISLVEAKAFLRWRSVWRMISSSR